MEAIRSRLEELGEQARSRWPLVSSFRGLLTTETVEKIKKSTSEPVYIILHYSFSGHPYSGGFALPGGASLLLEEDVLKKYPYLKKYPHWQRLFDQIDGTNCYLLGCSETDWLLKKTYHYEFKQRMS